MNVSILEIGKAYKNYPAMCEVLEVEEKKGSSRKYQIESWSRYFDYRRDGNSYVIEEVFETPKAKVEKRGGNNNSIFNDITKLLIVDMLGEQDWKLTIGKGELMKELGIVNDNYNKCKDITTKLSRYLNIDVDIVQDFYNLNNSNLNKIIERALKSLMNERRIIYHTITLMKEQGSYTYRKVTDDELRTIVTVEGNLMIKMGYANIDDVRRSKDWKEFRNVSKNIVQAMTSIDYYFTGYDIVIHEERILSGREELLESILEKSKRKEYKEELNGLVIESIDKNAKNRHETIDKDNKRYPTRIKNNYVKGFKTLTSKLNEIGAKSIIDDVSKIEDIKRIDSTNKELDEKVVTYIEKQLDGLFE